jgi:hypothetical protein
LSGTNAPAYFRRRNVDDEENVLRRRHQHEDGTYGLVDETEKRRKKKDRQSSVDQVSVFLNSLFIIANYAAEK